MNTKKIRIAIVGVGNCASSLIQGIYYYQGKSAESRAGLMHWNIGGYKPSDIEVSAAFDVDRRKVGMDVSKAIFEKPNCTAIFCDAVPRMDVPVRMGKILDGYSDHMANYPKDETFLLADQQPEPSQDDIVHILNP